METCDPREVGMDAARLVRLDEAIQADIDAERWDGCELVVSRRGRIVHQGRFGWADRAAGRPIAEDQVFVTMSIAKQFTVALVLACIERGDFALTTHVADLIPDFARRGKGEVTVAHVLTHTAGLPAMLPPMPAEQVGNLEAVVAATCDALLESRPGSRVAYSVIVGHAILAELVRRADGGRRPYRRILAEDLFEPLGMRDTALGLPAHLAPRLAPVVVRDRTPGLLDADFLELLGQALGPETEIPAGGCVSTAADVHRFAAMLRGSGALGDVRILSPATVEAATVIRTGTMTNSLFEYTETSRGWAPFPANLGLGFFVRGEGVHPTPFGTLASPRTFGGFGAGSSVFWVDPVRDLAYAFLSSGLVEESRSLDRHQRLADLVHAAEVA
jgi:CubicO group peptidase (beta-lactamase class C family)